MVGVTIDHTTYLLAHHTVAHLERSPNEQTDGSTVCTEACWISFHRLRKKATRILAFTALKGTSPESDYLAISCAQSGLSGALD